MSEHPTATTGSERPRTVTRMRFVAPPGMGLDAPTEGLKKVGRYEILETLGKGAMGVVFKARDPLLDRIVAVKTLVSPRDGGKRVRRAYLERFEREAKAAAKMQHPSIVTIFDVGLDDSGAPYMVLEYLPGETLADRLDQVRMPLGKAVQIALDLASALGFAHRERIVHRDVKPANVLHAGDGRWKLADFGIARMPDSDLTQVGIFMGTPGYAPPEAISQGRYTAQADVFAWGAVLYELLSGRIPYEGPDTRTTNGYVLKTTAKSPREHDASIPEPLADVVMQALHPSVDVRPKDGAEAEAALRQAWDWCTSHDMVKVQSLTGPEMPHEKVGATMHHTLPLRSQVGGVGGGAARSGRPSDRPPVADRAVVAAQRPGIGDDDPTRIMARPRPPEGGGARTSLDEVVELVTRARPAADRTIVDPTALEVDDDARTREAAPRRPIQDTSTAPARRSGNGGLLLWLAIGLVVLVAGAAVATYAMGLWGLTSLVPAVPPAP